MPEAAHPSDFATIRLPASAALLSATMALHNGRDLVARQVAQGGWQSFEPPLPRLFLAIASRFPGLVLDVGANTGFYTILAAAAHRRNRVVACEPLPEILEALHQNLRHNGLRHRARLIRCAIGDRNGHAELYIPDSMHGAIETSASLRADFKAVHAGQVSVLQRTLDRIVLRPSLIWRRLTIVKIDVEGCEAQVLSGAHRTIALKRPIIFLEILPRADFVVLNGFLKRHGYAAMVLPPDASPFMEQEVRFHANAWNHAFVPREKQQSFLAAAAAQPCP